MSMFNRSFRNRSGSSSAQAATVALAFGLVITPVEAGDANTVYVGAGETLSIDDLTAGEFMGQRFTLGPDTVIEVLNGGTLARIPARFGIGFNLRGTKINVRDGGVFNPTLGFPSDPCVVFNGRIELFDGGLIEEAFGTGGGTELIYSGGRNDDSMAVRSGSILRISDGVAHRAAISRTSIEMTGGALGLFTTINSSTGTLSNGSLGVFAGIGGESHLTMENFSISTTLRVFNTTQIEFLSGTIGDRLTLNDSAVMRIHAGTVGEEVRILDQSTLHLFVKEARLDGVIQEIAIGETIVLDQRDDSLLEVVLGDGTMNDFRLSDTAILGEDVFATTSTLMITRVPGSSTVSALSFGFLIASRRRRS